MSTWQLTERDFIHALIRNKCNIAHTADVACMSHIAVISRIKRMHNRNKIPLELIPYINAQISQPLETHEPKFEGSNAAREIQFAVRLASRIFTWKCGTRAPHVVVEAGMKSVIEWCALLDDCKAWYAKKDANRGKFRRVRT